MNNLTVMPPVGTQQGNWVWDGSNWVCDSDCDNQFPQPCPPFGPRAPRVAQRMSVDR